MSSSSASWKRVAVPPREANIASLSPEDNAEVIIHRKTHSNGDIMRAVLDLPVGEKGNTPMDMQTWKAVLSTPEMRREWDSAVEAAHLVEMFDPTTRIAKTNFTLGWPAKFVLFFFSSFLKLPDRADIRVFTALETLLQYRAHLLMPML